IARRFSDHRRGSPIFGPSIRNRRLLRSFWAIGRILTNNWRGMRRKTSRPGAGASRALRIVNGVPMRSLLLLAGILAVLWMPAEWQQVPAWWLAAALVPLLLWRRLRIATPALLGAMLALHAVGQVTRAVPLEPGERVMVEARIEGVPALDDSGWRFDAAIHFPRQPGWPPQRWRVRLPASMDAPAPGERWQYALRFDPPRDAAQRRLLMRDHVSAQARLVEGPFNQRIATSRGGLDALR